VNSDPVDLVSSLAGRDQVDDPRRTLADPQEEGGASMGDDAVAAASESGGSDPSLLGERGRPDRVDAAVHPMDPPVPNPGVDLVVGEAAST
jgi:hypothetical protein